jgi:two-component system sensor histidine kinase/response regulator
MTEMRPRVLLVDDVEANLLALEGELARLDCALVRAKSGNEALRQLLKHEFAVVLLDVQMPEIDGYEVARYARENPATRDVPIIFITAMHETEDNALRGYGAGAVDFLFKPINPSILRGKVQVFLELYLARKRLADEIEARKEALAELEAFNYSVSHDLRAPLRPLNGLSLAVLEDCGDKLDATAKDYLQRIRAAAQRMAQLIEDLLQLSRMGRTQVSLGLVDLADLANSIVAELRRAEPERTVEYTSVPEAKVEADGRLLRIVLENLLRNAWKFTQKASQPTIEFGIHRNDTKAVYFVRDNGAGFDPTQANRLFQPFQRLHSTAEFEGTGIGLAIVQRIIRRHDGRAWAEASPGKGATFFFTMHDRRAIDESTR